jgi:flagellar biosynthesis anti-sigma factor FlgM
MDIRSSLDGLRSLLGVTGQPAGSTSRTNAQAGALASGSDRATLSSAGSEVSESASADGVRMDKVAAVQQALQAGTYDVSASAVASKMVDAMLSRS